MLHTTRFSRFAAALVLSAAVTMPAFASSIELRAAGDLQRVLGAAERQDLSQVQASAPDAARQPQRASQGLRAKSHACCDIWVYGASIRLFDDDDDDGFYSYLSLKFDVDTYYSAADVYADVYLQDSYGDYTHIYQTRVFSIYGSDSSDAFLVDAELLSGFPADYYDVLIEVFDADNDHFVAEFSDRDSSALALLPMEDRSNDGYAIPVVHAHGTGGALSPLAIVILGLVGALLARHRGLRGNQSR